MSDQKPPEVQLQIQLDDAIANGQYVNMALVNHTETEFTLELGDTLLVYTDGLTEASRFGEPLFTPIE